MVVHSPAGTTSRRFATDGDEPEASLERGRVLVVADSGEGRRIICPMLGCLGLAAEAAESARDACRRAIAAAEAGRPFGLILIDTRMPGVDGYEAAGLLRSLGYAGRIVALASESIFERPRAQAIEAGCDGHAVKPITFECIRGVVRRWMPERPVTGQSAGGRFQR